MGDRVNSVHSETNWHESVLRLTSQIPKLLEPGTPTMNYRSLARRLQNLNCQQCLLELDELIERYSGFLSIVIPSIHIGEAGPCWDENDIKIDADFDQDRIDNESELIKKCVDDIVDLLQRYDTPENDHFIARLVCEFDGKKWQPDNLTAACRKLPISFGKSNSPEAWLARHRSYRQKMCLTEATPNAIAPTVRQRL